MNRTYWYITALSALIIVLMVIWWPRGPRYTSDHAVAAAAAGDVILLQEIIATHPHLINAETRSSGASLLLVAVRSGNLAAIKFLLDQGLDPAAKDKRGQGVLNMLSPDTNVDTIALLKLLSKNGQVLDPTLGGDLLLLAAYVGDQNLIDYLLNAGIAPSFKDSKGRDALHASASAGNKGLMEYLQQIEPSLNPNRPDNDGISAMDLLIDAVEDQAGPIE